MDGKSATTSTEQSRKKSENELNERANESILKNGPSGMKSLTGHKNVIISLPRVHHRESKRTLKRIGEASNDNGEPIEKKIRLKPSILETSVKEAQSGGSSPELIKMENGAAKMDGVASESPTIKASESPIIEDKVNPECEVASKTNGETNGNSHVTKFDIKSTAVEPEIDANITQSVHENSENGHETPAQSSSTNQINNNVTEAMETAEEKPNHTESSMTLESSMAFDSSTTLDKSSVIDFNQSGFSDLNASGLFSFEDLSTMANIDGLDWEHSFTKEIEDTLKSTTAKMCANLQLKFKAKFDFMKNNFKTIKSERDKILSDIDQTKLKLKEDHAKEIAELNENHAQAMTTAKNEITTYWTGELEKVKSKAEEDLKEIKSLMNDKLKQVENTYEEIKAEQNKERDECSRTITELQEKHKNEIETEKQRMNDEIVAFKKTHDDKLIELQNKLKEYMEEKGNIKSEVEAKYCGIVASMKQKVEKDRMTCECCGKESQTKRVCSEECYKLW